MIDKCPSTIHYNKEIPFEHRCNSHCDRQWSKPMRQISRSPLSLIRQIFLKLAVSTTHNSAIRPFCRPHGCVLSVDSGSLVYLPPELPPCMAGWSRWLARTPPPPWSAAGATAASSPRRAPSASESASEESSLLSSGGSRTPFTSPWA